MKEKILALLEQEAFRAELEKLGSAEEILAAFKAKGVEVTVEDLQALVGGLGELDLDELDNVSGGARVSLGIVLLQMIKRVAIIC